MERRQHTRISTDIIPGRLGNRIPVEVMELSLEGIGLEARAALRPGGNYKLSLLEGSAKVLETKVIWCRLDRSERSADGRSQTVYRAGLSRVGGGG